MFYTLLGRLTWMAGKWFFRRRVAATTAAQRVGAAAVVLAILGLGVWAATREPGDEAV